MFLVKRFLDFFSCVLHLNLKKKTQEDFLNEPLGWFLEFVAGISHVITAEFSTKNPAVIHLEICLRIFSAILAATPLDIFS